MVACAVGVLALAVALGAGARWRRVAEIRALSPPERTRIFSRALDDLKTTCARREETDGPVREHCRGQAEFLTLFPECDARCQLLVSAALPHARR